MVGLFAQASEVMVIRLRASVHARAIAFEIYSSCRAARTEPRPGGSQGIVTRNAVFKSQKLTQKSLFRPAKVLYAHASLATRQYRQQGNQQHLLLIMARCVASPWVLNFMR